MLGVDNENEIEAVITNQRFVAGINFQHSPVSSKINNVLSLVVNELLFFTEY